MSVSGEHRTSTSKDALMTVPNNLTQVRVPVRLPSGVMSTALRSKNLGGRVGKNTGAFDGELSFEQDETFEPQVFEAPVNTVVDEPELPTEAAPAPVRVRGARYWFTVTPGVLDAEAKDLFQRGHCVAFAAAYAERVGAEHVTMIIDSRDDSVIHAFVEQGDGMMVDSNGVSNFAEWFEKRNFDAWYSKGHSMARIDVSEARRIKRGPYKAFLPKQDYKLAESMMDPFMEGLSAAD
jgi:hypothetical protein